jgi:hypothetical protein
MITFEREANIREKYNASARMSGVARVGTTVRLLERLARTSV